MLRVSGLDIMPADGLAQAVIGHRGRHRGIHRAGRRLAARRSPAPVRATTFMFVPDMRRCVRGLGLFPGEAAAQARLRSQAPSHPDGRKCGLDPEGRRSNLEARRREEEALYGQRIRAPSQNPMTLVPGRYRTTPCARARCAARPTTRRAR